jgi:hypothetical protein
LQRKAFRLSAVRPTMTSGGDTRVLINKATLTNPQRRLNFFISEASVIFMAFAERTRNITEILFFVGVWAGDDVKEGQQRESVC